VISVAPTGKRAGDPGNAWTSNENIEATMPQATIKAIFDINVFPSHDAIIVAHGNFGLTSLRALSLPRLHRKKRANAQKAARSIKAREVNEQK
jgi:hypothetical protein